MEERRADAEQKFDKQKMWLESVRDHRTGAEALGALIVMSGDTWASVAKKAGTTKQRLQSIKNGKRIDIYADFLADCCEAMGYQLCIVKNGEIAPDKCIRIRGEHTRWTR